jgi:hypothetical protein
MASCIHDFFSNGPPKMVASAAAASLRPRGTARRQHNGGGGATGRQRGEMEAARGRGKAARAWEGGVQESRWLQGERRGGGARVIVVSNG